MLRSFQNLSLLVFSVSGLAVCANAQIVTVPSLPAGSQYRLIFVTSGTTAATSTNIATYNTFVTTQANLATALQSISWTAVGTTDTVNAITNIGANTGVPVYNLAGQLVVSTTVLLFNGLSTAYAHPINVDQSGNTVGLDAEGIWTGTWDGGIKHTTFGSALGDATPYDGSSGYTTYLAYDGSADTASNLHPMYAISGVLTVPALPTTPAPSSLWLIAIGLAAIGAYSFYRTRLASLR